MQMDLYLADPTLICFGVLDSFSLQEIAEANDVDIRAVREWIATGELKGFVVSRDPKSKKPVYRVHEDDWIRFRECRSNRPPVEKPTRRKAKLPEVQQWV